MRYLNVDARAHGERLQSEKELVILILLAGRKKEMDIRKEGCKAVIS
jgi:hypothetical protein